MRSVDLVSLITLHSVSFPFQELELVPTWSKQKVSMNVNAWNHCSEVSKLYLLSPHSLNALNSEAKTFTALITLQSGQLSVIAKLLSWDKQAKVDPKMFLFLHLLCNSLLLGYIARTCTPYNVCVTENWHLQYRLRSDPAPRTVKMCALF